MTRRPFGDGLLRCGVVGAGVFGSLHAGKYAAAPNVRFVGVYDPDRDAARRLTDVHGGRAFETRAALTAEADAVTVASPAATHFEAARQALAAGRHVLVEKPLALRAEEAAALVAAADERGAALQVGHQERFVVRALGLFAPPRPVERLAFRRAGVDPGRCRDASVVFDLMIHDIDLLLQYAPGRPRAVEAAGRRLYGEALDEAAAHVVFDDGLRADLFASRMADAPARTMTLALGGAETTFDFLSRRIAGDGEAWASASADETSHAATDPVGFGVTSFIHSIRSGRPTAITGRDGMRAVELAERIEAAALAGLQSAV